MNIVISHLRNHANSMKRRGFSSEQICSELQERTMNAALVWAREYLNKPDQIRKIFAFFYIGPPVILEAYKMIVNRGDIIAYENLQPSEKIRIEREVKKWEGLVWNDQGVLIIYVFEYLCSVIKDENVHTLFVRN